MLLRENRGNNYTYEYQMPRFANLTNVFGLAKAIDKVGNVAYSSSEPVSMYYVFTPPPLARIDFGFYVYDVNPRFLNATVFLSASLYNTQTFAPITLQSITNALFLRLSHQSAECCWDILRTVVLNTYSGIPQLFPFDTYTYTLDLSLSDLLNYRSHAEFSPGQAQCDTFGGDKLLSTQSGAGRR